MAAPQAKLHINLEGPPIVLSQLGGGTTGIGDGELLESVPLLIVCAWVLKFGYEGLGDAIL